MACIILKSALGERKIPENTPYRLLVGEALAGVDWDCGEVLQVDVEAELKKAGLQLGDAIAWVTKKVGIKQCAPCKARQEILNHVSELGWTETIKQIRGTFNGS